MRRTRFTRNRSSRLRSSFRYGSRMGMGGFYRTGRGIPLKGPAAILVSIFIILFLVFFILNFVFAIFLPDFLFEVGIWFFFVPFFSIIGIFITTIIASIISVAKGQPLQGFANDGLGGPSFFDMAIQLGVEVTTLKQQDPSTAQAVIQSNNMIVLVKLLNQGQAFENGMVQNLSKGLVTYQAKEAWLIQQTPTFVENDLNFARFYNVKLLSLTEAIQALQALAPKPSTNQGQ